MTTPPPPAPPASPPTNVANSLLSAVSKVTPNPLTSQLSNTAAAFNLPNFFEFLSMISPYLVVFFILFNTIVNSNLKGMIYMLGLLILFMMSFLFQKMFKSNGLAQPDPICNLFQLNVTLESVPSFSVALITYTFFYIVLPMITNKVINYPFIIILSFIFIINVYYRITKKCTTLFGAITGGFLGLIWGSIYYAIIKNTNSSLTFYDDFISNKVACSRPSQQKFKCSVYKNGELLQTI